MPGQCPGLFFFIVLLPLTWQCLAGPSLLPPVGPLAKPVRAGTGSAHWEWWEKQPTPRLTTILASTEGGLDMTPP